MELFLKRTINDKADKAIFKEADQTFEIEESGNIKEIRFDPQNWIFKDLKYEYNISNEKFALENFDITTKSYRRKVDISYNATKNKMLQWN